ncbi:MAG: hypothetical protein ISN64_04230 [Rickettsia sp.]|nr:hypothetical protein [Rickettsia sp.]
MKIIFSFLLFCSFLIFTSCTDKNKPVQIEFKNYSKVLSVAFLYNKEEFSSERVEEYQEVLAEKLNKKIKLKFFESEIESLETNINNILENNYNIIIIGSNNYEYNKKIIDLSKEQIAIFSPTNFEELANKSSFIFGLSDLESIKTLVNYFLYSKNHSRFFFLLPEEYSTKEIQDKMQIFLSPKSGIRYRFFYYNLNTINRNFKTISRLIDKQNSHLEKTSIIILGKKLQFNEIFSVASMFGLEKKAVISGTHNSDINFDLNFSITFAGLASLLNAKDDNYYLFNDDEYNKFLFHDIALLINEVLLKNSNIMLENNFLQSFLDHLNSNNFYLDLGKTNFKNSIAVRKYSIIKKTDGVYNILWSNY